MSEINLPVDIVLRQVPGYGWLPIVREYNPTTGAPGMELYRGEFKASVILAAYAGQKYKEVKRCA